MRSLCFHSFSFSFRSMCGTQREFSNDCIFNERMEDNYNYYTSTHHSTALRTFYVALNRLGGPRVTYLPANKPLGKLSTYVKSFTLIVPEHRSEALISRLFGANHVKHGIKHLCDSDKELKALNARTMHRPECQMGAKTIVPNKKATNHSNHSNHSHTKRVPSTAPAALIERRPPHNGRTHANNNCASVDNCPKKKRKNFARNGGTVANNSTTTISAISGEPQEMRPKQKQAKGAVKRVNKGSRKTTLMATVMPSNGSIIGNRFQSMSPKRWPALDDSTAGGHFDDALNDSSSASIPILSNGHVALNDGDDVDIDYDDRWCGATHARATIVNGKTLVFSHINVHSHTYTRHVISQMHQRIDGRARQSVVEQSRVWHHHDLLKAYILF